MKQGTQQACFWCREGERTCGKWGVVLPQVLIGVLLSFSLFYN